MFVRLLHIGNYYYVNTYVLIYFISQFDNNKIDVVKFAYYLICFT